MTKEQMNWEELKDLPVTEEGLFDLTEVDANFYEAARLVYPLYAAYETECNKKAGYPDILAQMRKIDKKLNDDYIFANAARVADAMIHTIDRMSPEIYEYYRELVDLFKKNVKKAMRELETEGVAAADSESLRLFRSAVEMACRQHILLAEKYLMD